MSTSTQVRCALCGLDSAHPIHKEIDGQSLDFCCIGCREVYLVLKEASALDCDPSQSPVFREAKALGIVSQRESEKNGANPSLPESECKTQPFDLDGMWCPSCAWVIERALMKQNGVRQAEVQFNSDRLTVTYHPRFLGTDEIRGVVRRLGYRAIPSGQIDAHQQKIRRRSLLRLGIGGMFALNIMMLNFVIYVGLLQSLPPGAAYWFPRIIAMLSLPVIFYAGFPIWQRAWGAIRHLAPNMELLIALGVGAAFGYSGWVLLNGGIGVYFDTAAMIVMLVVIGKHIELETRYRVTQSLRSLYQLLPKKAIKLVDGREHPVPIDQLIAGDRIVVRPGDRIPTDGKVISGVSAADEALLTGEAKPVMKRAGDSVYGGSLNGKGALDINVTSPSEQSVASQIVRLVEKSLTEKSPAQRFADRLSRIFVPVIIMLALGTFIALYFTSGDLAAAIIRAVTVLVIACPCALGIATPLAVTIGVGRAASEGLLLKSPDLFEKLDHIQHILIDKTGTLTEGRFTVREWLPTQHADLQDDLSAIVSVERMVDHPIAKAILKYAEDRKERLFLAENVETETGIGVSGFVKGRRWWIRSYRYVLSTESGVMVSDELRRRADSLAAEGNTVVLYGCEGEVRGVLALGDHLRPNASAVVKELKRANIRIEVVSGDGQSATETMARLAGADGYAAQLTPADKLQRVRKLQQSGKKVMMVGDGINDAPALAQSDIGVGIGSGAVVAVEAADIALLAPDLERLPRLFATGHLVRKKILQNLIWASLYNVLAVPLAMIGWISPAIAALAMLCSSLSVVYNSSRISRVALSDPAIRAS